MRSTAPLSTGMHIAIPLSGARAADTGRLALPESPCCRGRHDFPDEPLRPRDCLQALQFEEKGLGRLSEGRDVVCTDALSGAGLLRVRFTSSREAKLQLTFYR